MLYGEQKYLENGGWTSFHGQICANTFLISQGDTGSVVMVDRRVGWDSPVTTCRLWDRVHPKSVSVHPVQTQYFLTGTNKVGRGCIRVKLIFTILLPGKLLYIRPEICWVWASSDVSGLPAGWPLQVPVQLCLLLPDWRPGGDSLQ